MNLIDIHCHPSMKIYLFNRHIYTHFHPQWKNLSINMYVNLPNMREGSMNAAVSVHYLPEYDLSRAVFGTFAGNILEKIIMFFHIYVVRQKFEDRSYPQKPFKQMLGIIQKFEDDIKAANKISGKDDVAIARNFTEFEAYVDAGKIVFIHSIEGANCLGHGITDVDILLGEIQTLFDLGVCQFTIGHFFENVLVSSQGGIPPHICKLLKYSTGNTYLKGYNEVNDITKTVITKMLDLGIIVDLVHCTEGTKNMVFELNNARGANKRPIVFSHTGVREVVLKYKPEFPENDQLYLPNTEDILKIKDCGGVLGIIFMDYWLIGSEVTSNALDIIIETIQFIYKVCGNSYENIAIGSDLDGFTSVPSDLLGSNYMDEFVIKMKASGISEEGIKAICFENYRRVLKNGWGEMKPQPLS